MIPAMHDFTILRRVSVFSAAERLWSDSLHSLTSKIASLNVEVFVRRQHYLQHCSFESASCAISS